MEFPSPAGLSAARLADVHSFLAGATRRDFLGAVALVARDAPDGGFVSLRAHGHRDLERRIRQRDDDIFAIYSLTKPLLTAAVMILVDEGRVRLDAPVKDYVPPIGRLWPAKPMTVRQLLTHTAGFGADPAAAERAADLEGYVEAVSKMHLAYEPGTRFAYHSANSEVAARLVELVSGQRFAEFLKGRLLDPLKMSDTGFEVPAAQRHRLAAMTSHDASGRLVAWPVGDAPRAGGRLRAYDSAAGGLYSTVPDYYRFARMMLDGGVYMGRRILSQRSVAAMMTHQLTFLDPPVNQYGEGFGLGGFVNLDRPGRERPGSVGAWGWSGASGTYLMIDPKERLISMLFMQHLPQGLANDPKKLSFRFYNLVYQSLEKSK